ncbi:MAG: hypothetical protein JNK64_21895 [Myxococcales bacterium]|nr:hypothetical protein [Myxococcales bacterium]
MTAPRAAIAIAAVGLVASAPAHAQPSAPPPSPSPCGDLAADPTVSYVCSTLRIAPTRQLTEYREFVALRPRDGRTLGVRLTSTFTQLHRRDGVDVDVGLVVDRRGLLRLVGGPARAQRDGVGDWGADLRVGFAWMMARAHVGAELGTVLGIRYSAGRAALGLGAFAGYELVATDRVALTLGGRLGVEYYDHRAADGSTSGNSTFVAALTLGVDYYTTYR